MRIDEERMALMYSALSKRGVLAFTMQSELITFVADLLTYEYIELMRCRQLKDKRKDLGYLSWKEKMDTESGKYREALEEAILDEVYKEINGIKGVLKRFRVIHNTIKIDQEHPQIIQKALTTCGSELKANDVISPHVSMVLDLEKCLLKKSTNKWRESG